MGQELFIEIFHSGQWHKAAIFSAHGVTGTHFEDSTLEYDIDYVLSATTSKTHFSARTSWTQLLVIGFYSQIHQPGFCPDRASISVL